MKILITGGSGQLGTELRKQLSEGRSVLGTIPDVLMEAEILSPSRQELDICNEKAVNEYFYLHKPDAVIHSAAMSDVEGCEDQPDLCEMINGIAVGYVASACESIGAKLVFLSSDYVFSGDKNSPYQPDDPCAPLSVYGKGKRLGEINALNGCSKTFVVRTSWLYGFSGKNFVKAILRKAESGSDLKVVNDQIGSPTNVEDLSYHLLKLVVTEQYGIYHCTGKGACSWFDFAEEIIKQSGIQCNVSPCSSADYPQKATRPHYSVMDNSTLEYAVGNDMRCWKEAIQDFIQRLEKSY